MVVKFSFEDDYLGGSGQTHIFKCQIEDEATFYATKMTELLKDHEVSKVILNKYKSEYDIVKDF